MTDEEEFEARSLLKWQRVNALEWVLLYRRKKMGRVISDEDCPEMYEGESGSVLLQNARIGNRPLTGRGTPQSVEQTGFRKRRSGAF